MNGNLRTPPISPVPQLPAAQNLRINTKLREDLLFLHEFLQKVQVVKVGSRIEIR